MDSRYVFSILSRVLLSILVGSSFVLVGCEDESYVGDDFDPGSGNGGETDGGSEDGGGGGSTPDTESPTTPSISSLVGWANATQAKTASWSASTDNVGVDHYEIAMGTTGVGSGTNDLVGPMLELRRLTKYVMASMVLQ